MTLVTVTICGDIQRLSTPLFRPSEEALARYARRLLALLAKEFSAADFSLILGDGLSVESDDSDLAARVHSRVADIQAGEEWIELAFGYDNPTT